jgi:esterase/lipase
LHFLSFVYSIAGISNSFQSYIPMDTNSTEIPAYQSVPVLVIHGLTGTTTQFSSLKTRLEAENIPCFVPHLTGHRMNIPAPSEVRLHAIELELAGYLAYLKKKPDDKIIILGQSMGALLAIHLAAQFPDAIERLILLSPGVRLRKKFHNHFNTSVSRLPFFLTKRLGSIKKKWVSKNHEKSDTGYPLTLLKHLGTLQKNALQNLSALSTRITVIQNEKDYHLSPEIPDLITRHAVKSKVDVHYQNWGPHHSLAHIPEVQDLVLQAITG